MTRNFLSTPAPAPLECLGCQKSFHTASPDAIVRDGGTCTDCGSALIHAGLAELLPAA
jgi:rRNA maturation endonuclease Nob1